jgi:hypothetical protein
MTVLTLLALDHTGAAHLATEPAAFARRHALTLAPHESTLVAIAAATAQMLTNSGAAAPWCGYLAIEEPLVRRVVGTGGFKSPPDANGAVEGSRPLSLDGADRGSQFRCDRLPIQRAAR